MKHSGKATKAALKMIIISLIAVLVILAMGVFASFIGVAIVAITPVLIVAWIAFALFTLYFFRDPNADVPAGANLVLCPGHGKVDAIDTTTESLFMGGECQRVSVFLSVINVHVQNAPVGGKSGFLQVHRR